MPPKRKRRADGAAESKGAKAGKEAAPEEEYWMAPELWFSQKPMTVFPGISTMAQFCDLRIPQGKPSDHQKKFHTENIEPGSFRARFHEAQWEYFDICTSVCLSPAQVAASYFDHAVGKQKRLERLRRMVGQNPRTGSPPPYAYDYSDSAGSAAAPAAAVPAEVRSFRVKASHAWDLFTDLLSDEAGAAAGAAAAPAADVVSVSRAEWKQLLEEHDRMKNKLNKIGEQLKMFEGEKHKRNI